MLRYAARVNSLSELAITKLDVLDQLETIRVCVAYEADGQRHDQLPYHQSVLHRATPVYEDLPAADKPTFECVKSYDNWSTPTDVHLDLHLDVGKFEAVVAKHGLEKAFKLTETLNLGHMHLYGSDGSLKLYGSLQEILDEFCDLRQEGYAKRKVNLLLQDPMTLTTLKLTHS